MQVADESPNCNMPFLSWRANVFTAAIADGTRHTMSVDFFTNCAFVVVVAIMTVKIKDNKYFIVVIVCKKT